MSRMLFLFSAAAMCGLMVLWHHAPKVGPRAPAPAAAPRVAPNGVPPGRTYCTDGVMTAPDWAERQWAACALAKLGQP